MIYRKIFRCFVWIFMAAMMVFSMCGAGISREVFADMENGERYDGGAAMEVYLHYGADTDPGEYERAFVDLPEDLQSLCTLIKSQFIHPAADLPRYRHLLPEGRENEDEKYPTVRALLKGLYDRDSRGLVFDRAPECRLVVSCRYHALLLGAILKYQGVPVRIRYGFASYLGRGRFVYHVICEVWDAERRRWILVDPDRERVNFPEEEFSFAGKVWQEFRRGNLNPALYGVGDWWGFHPVLDILCHDMAAVLGHEPIYWEQPPISSDPLADPKKLSEEQLAVLDRVAFFLEDPQRYYLELRELYETHDFLQFP